jgi:hypothetical protein
MHQSEAKRSGETVSAKNWELEKLPVTSDARSQNKKQQGAA